MAIPIAAVKPGRAPKMMPRTTPKVAMKTLNGRKTFFRTSRIEIADPSVYPTFLDQISSPWGNQMYSSVWKAPYRSATQPSAMSSAFSQPFRSKVRI